MANQQMYNPEECFQDRPERRRNGTIGSATPSRMLSNNVYFPNPDFSTAKTQLSEISRPEYWGGNEKRILHNYITQLFASVARRYIESISTMSFDDILSYQNGISISFDGQYLCLNTGLADGSFNFVYGHFERNKNPGYQPWVFKSWYNVFDMDRLNFHSQLPEKFSFVNEFHELYFKIRLNLGLDHILEDNESHSRLQRLHPGASREELHRLLQGAIAQMRKRVLQNSRTVVPQYWNQSIQLLLPLAFNGINGEDSVQLAIPVVKVQLPLPRGVVRDPWNPTHWRYDAHTILTHDMAYNNARLLNSLESDWLKPNTTEDNDDEEAEEVDDVASTTDASGVTTATQGVFGGDAVPIVHPVEGGGREAGGRGLGQAGGRGRNNGRNFTGRANRRNFHQQ